MVTEEPAVQSKAPGTWGKIAEKITKQKEGGEKREIGSERRLVQ